MTPPRTAALVLMLLLPGAAGAACATGAESFLTCTVSEGRKTVSVCVLGDRATYAFGPTGGTPELVLERSAREVGYTPWPGVSRTIWEEVAFRNGAFAYLVYGSIDRLPDPEDPDSIASEVGGGVVVMRGQEELAHLRCDPGSTDFSYSEVMSDAKAAAGQCWDRDRFVWSDCG